MLRVAGLCSALESELQFGERGVQRQHMHGSMGGI